MVLLVCMPGDRKGEHAQLFFFCVFAVQCSWTGWGRGGRVGVSLLLVTALMVSMSEDRGVTFHGLGGGERGARRFMAESGQK